MLSVSWRASLTVSPCTTASMTPTLTWYRNWFRQRGDDHGHILPFTMSTAIKTYPKPLTVSCFLHSWGMTRPIGTPEWFGTKTLGQLYNNWYKPLVYTTRRLNITTLIFWRFFVGCVSNFQTFDGVLTLWMLFEPKDPLTDFCNGASLTRPVHTTMYSKTGCPYLCHTLHTLWSMFLHTSVHWFGQVNPKMTMSVLAGWNYLLTAFLLLPVGFQINVVDTPINIFM